MIVKELFVHIHISLCAYASYDGLMLFIASPRRVLDAVMLS